MVHERDMGFNNKAVIGGLDAYVSNWVRGLDDDPELAERARRVAQLFSNYDTVPVPQRQSIVREAIRLIRSKKSKPTAPVPTTLHTFPIPSATMADIPEDDEDEPVEEPSPKGSAPHKPVDYGLDAPVTKLHGVGEKRSKNLGRLGIETIRDLLYHFPFRYNDYQHRKKISELMYGQDVTLVATVLDCKTRQLRGNPRFITNVLLGDATGTLSLTFFNRPFLQKQWRVGSQLSVSGRVDRERNSNKLTINNPECEPFTKELLHTNGIIPVYPQTEGVTSRSLRPILREVVNTWADKIPDPLTNEIRKRADVIDLGTAIRAIHIPHSWPANERARRRLAFDEFLNIQIGVLKQRQVWRAATGIALDPDANALAAFRESLPFALTNAQERALGDILKDIGRPVPMSRLLQGDVGSGKTVVAAMALLLAVANGTQGVIMAPTEILAEQHFKTISRLMDEFRARYSKLSPRVGLLIGSMKEREKVETREKLASGEIDIAIGTHALIQESVAFKKLALAVIDEQHRFGVEQRSAIRQKGFNPHVLVMSATPIPRTLALTLFGDLDLSIIDQLPPGRQPIQTKWLIPSERNSAYRFIAKQVSQGRQAFVICPLIEESEAIDAKAAVEEYERLRKEVYPDLHVGLVHGKLRPSDKDAEMAKFRDGETQILVATSVVEVGIDVPNASVMLIEGADRFGLAQLHQFRGRVGRGADKSYCLLLAEKKESASDQRLQIIETTHDGFKLAEEDLKMRGPGEFFGTRQSGLPDLQVAKLSDVKILELARRVAEELAEADPDLSNPEHKVLAENVRMFWKGKGDLS